MATNRPLDLVELAEATGRTVEVVAAGDEVEVRNRFDRRWSAGFRVVAVQSGRCRVRRESDGVVLPVAFPPGDVRRRRAVVAR